jgi:aminoglycoside 6'-N-acetyltransferase
VSYTFRPMTAADLRLARRWLRSPEVVEWWGDPDHELTLLEEDLDDPNMTMWIVAFDGRAFAYIQDYDPLAWDMHHFADLPAGSRGIDQFIGEPDMIGLGHGSEFVRRHVDWLMERGAPAIGVDPDPENFRAIRAYEKAGFHRGDVVETEWGPSLLMTRFNPDYQT